MVKNIFTNDHSTGLCIVVYLETVRCDVSNAFDMMYWANLY